MSAVRGIEWVKNNQLLVYSYPDPPSYGNRKVKSELLHLKINSGKLCSVTRILIILGKKGTNKTAVEILTFECSKNQTMSGCLSRHV